MQAIARTQCHGCKKITEHVVDASGAYTVPGCDCGCDLFTILQTPTPGEFVGLAPRLPDATDADWIILWGSPSATIGNWFYGTPREVTEDDKALHRAIKHHQP